EEGLELTPPMIAKASALCAPNATAQTTPETMQALLEMHALLTKSTAPATPSSIEATARGTRFWEFLSRPPLVGGMIVVALAALVGFILTLPEDPTAPSANALSMWNEFHWTLAAALG